MWVSNVVALVILFIGGNWFGRYAGGVDWQTGLVMAAAGGVLVSIIMTLGGGESAKHQINRSHPGCSSAAGSTDLQRTGRRGRYSAIPDRGHTRLGPFGHGILQFLTQPG